MDKEPGMEKGSTSSAPAPTPSVITLAKAVDLGEYNPEYLSTFPDWHLLSSHIQFQYIRKALDIRHRQLITHYAELSNTLHFSEKPQVQQAMKNVEKQLSKLSQDKERLYVEYASQI